MAIDFDLILKTRSE